MSSALDLDRSSFSSSQPLKLTRSIVKVSKLGAFSTMCTNNSTCPVHPANPVMLSVQHASIAGGAMDEAPSSFFRLGKPFNRESGDSKDIKLSCKCCRRDMLSPSNSSMGNLYRSGRSSHRIN
ncbi:hypothetical protein U9M48_044842 [Paspalum notatum var. saurae]|uniref:Uncharacterized protein n=1 Tax=Paspalum notatum var. saurae TaxID=547442 RepID=A0AAQ3UVW9_PASNO